MMEIQALIKRVKQIEISSRKNASNQLMGRYHSAFKGQGMAFSEVRNYQFGDDIRRMDWNKTAQFNESFIKLAQEERECAMVLMVDVSASMNFATQHQSKRDYVAEICATLAWSSIKNNDKVGLILFSDKIIKVMPALKGEKHLLAMLSAILNADYSPAESNYNLAFDYLLNLYKRKALVFLLSDFNQIPQGNKLGILGKKHQMLGIRVCDEAEKNLPNIGVIQWRNPETGQQAWVDTSSPKWRQNYQASHQAHWEALKQQFDKNQTSLMDLATNEDYALALMKYFKKK